MSAHTFLVLTATVLAFGMSSTARAESASILLEKAIFAEQTKGDLDAAMKIYKQILTDAKANRAFAARAQFRLGLCHLKKKQTDEAAAAFRKVVTDFPDQKKIVASAKAQLAKLAPKATTRPREPIVVKTTPAAFANDVPASLTKITATFDRAMMDKAWSWMRFSKETFPQTTGKPSFDKARRTCTLPVKFEPGKVYWVGVNAEGRPEWQYFQTPEQVPAREYVILFATRGADGKATPIPENLLARAKKINAKTPKLPSRADRMAAEKLAAQAWRLWRQRKLVEAEKLFQQAVDKDWTNANTWNGLGWAQLNQGKRASAQAAFEECVAIEPAHAAGFNGLGWIAKGRGKTAEAVGYWQKAVTAMPTATAALNGLATTYMELGQYDKAAEIYQKWLKVAPADPNATAGLKQAKAAATAIKPAIAAAEKWLKLVDAGKYGEAWDAAAAYFKGAVARQNLQASLKTVRGSLAAVTSRKLLSATYRTSLPGAPDGQYVIIQYTSSFEKKAKAVETITPMKDADGAWRVSGYYIK